MGRPRGKALHWLGRLLLVPGLLLLGCVVAAAYGALHNQISYRVAPEYFHKLKFIQFAIPEDLHGPAGAALVGVEASWWMGLFIGFLPALIGLGMPRARQHLRAFLALCILVTLLALAAGLASLFFPVSPEDYAGLLASSGVADPAAFWQAAQMHDIAYMAGEAGMFLAAIAMALMTTRARRRAAQGGGAN